MKYVYSCCWLWLVAAAPGAEPEVVYPVHANVIDVTQAPYRAKGDGKTDDTAAIQQAINEHTGQGRIIYFPPGTYLISETIKWPKKWQGRDNWGYTTLQGRSSAKSIIRLKDGTFTDEKQPQAMMWCGGFGSADWFHNHVQGLTFSVGQNNPGATALQFYSNNYGAVRYCHFLSEDGLGHAGLDLGHRDMNGPLLVRRVTVTGFKFGIGTARSVNSQTFEYITLKNQATFGFDNHGQAITIRGLTFNGAVPAVRNYGTLCLLESELNGTGEAKKAPALINYNNGHVMVRDVKTMGFARALGDVKTPDYVQAYRLTGEDKPGSLGPTIQEYFSHAATSAFPSATGSLRLAIEETPEFAPEDPKKWAVVDTFGADPTGEKDSTEAIQKALDSGAATVFFPGHYAITETLVVNEKVTRIVGIGRWVDYKGKAKPDFRIADSQGPTITFEHFSHINGGIENASNRTVVLRSIGTRFASKGNGKIFMEDVAGDDLKIGKQQLFARQLNIENEGTHLLNDGGQAWVLGYKTERGGTLVHTKNGGQTEILGGFSYTTTAGKLAPMFVTENAATFAYFDEVCYSGDPFKSIIQESRGKETKTLDRKQADTRPYIGVPKK